MCVRQEYYTSDIAALVHHIRSHVMSICPTTGDVNFDNLVKLVSDPGYLHFFFLALKNFPFITILYSHFPSLPNQS